MAQSPSRYVEKQKPNGQQMLGAETEGLSGLLAPHGMATAILVVDVGDRPRP